MTKIEEIINKVFYTPKTPIGRTVVIIELMLSLTMLLVLFLIMLTLLLT